MSKWIKTLAYAAFIAGLTLGSLPAQAADPVNDAQKAQGKLLAQRAARADAIRKLAERIKGLKITSETNVRDFIAENDTIQTALNAFLTGMRETKVRYMDDGTCEVTMEVTLETIVTTLKEIHNRYYKGDKFKNSDFAEMTQRSEFKVITETGSGVPRPVYEPASDYVASSQESSGGSPAGLYGKSKAYWYANVTPQGRLLAVRAARADGMRKLVERIKGVQVDSETVVRDFVTEKDEINMISRAVLSGAREVAIRYHDDEPIVEVKMEVTLETVYATLKSLVDVHYKGDVAKIKNFQEYIERTETKVLSETGMGIPRIDTVKTDKQTISTLNDMQKNWPPLIQEKGNAAIDTANENKAQAKLMAMRGAELDARRKLAERIDGLTITSKTTVHDFIAENDEIRTAMLTFQQGGYVIDGSQKTLDDGTVEVTVAIDPEPLWNIIIHYQKTTNMSVQPREE